MSEQEFYVCWRGDSWRDAPQPVQAQPVTRVYRTTMTGRIARRSQVGHYQKRHVAKELVYACVDACFASVNAVMDRTDLSDRTVRRILMQGVEIGDLERVEQGRIGYAGGYPTYLYRRVRPAQQEQAA